MRAEELNDEGVVNLMVAITKRCVKDITSIVGSLKDKNEAIEFIKKDPYGIYDGAKIEDIIAANKDD